MLALPFWKLVVTVKKPQFSVEIDENSHVGLHIRKRRFELKLSQKDVAGLIGVTEESVMYWETDFAVPQIQHIPKVIRFLGYNPYPHETQTLGGRIKLYRLLHGLSHKRMGKLVGVNGSTISCWETGRFPPDGLNRRKLEELLSK